MNRRGHQQPTPSDLQPSPRFRLAFATALCLALAGIAGCTSLRQWKRNGFKVGPNFRLPAAQTAPAWVDAGDPRVKSDPVQDCAWWTVFNDPLLNSLIETAHRQNIDLRVAGTRILEARAQRNISAGNLFPQSQTALSSYAHGQLSENLGLLPGSNVNLFVDGFNASWEVDFWGRFRRSVEASDADLAAAYERYGDTLVLLLSEVATSYVQLRTFEQRLAYAQQNVAIQRGSLKIAEDRHNTGRASELDVRQARSNLAQTEAIIPTLITGRRRANNQLCVLLGMPVTDFAGEFPEAGIPQAPVEVAVGIPADLLRRRPDIRRASREVAAQSARVGVAEADLYPHLAVNGFIGYAADDLRELLDSRSFIGFVIPTLQWNVLNYGRIRNNVRVQDARLHGAALQYQQTVLKAGREVEDALVGFLQAQHQAQHLEESVHEAERFVELVILQFEAGVTDFNRVFNAQSTLVNLQDQLAVAQGNISLNLIQVYKALGGGWQCLMCGPGGAQPIVDQPASPVDPPGEEVVKPESNAIEPRPSLP